MANRNVKKVAIDRNKLTEEFRKIRVPLSAASTEMGFSDTYISSVLLKGEIPERSAKMIETFFGIPVERYQLKAEPEPKNGGFTVKDLTAEQLRQLIYKAVRQAFEEVL